MNSFFSERKKYNPNFPPVLANIRNIAGENIPDIDLKNSPADLEALDKLFSQTKSQPTLRLQEQKSPSTSNPSTNLKIAVVLSGGPAPGGHNVICGIFDAFRDVNPKTQLIGFKDGPAGIVNNQWMELTPEIIDAYRNTGGFDMIGTGRTKIETEDQFAAAYCNLSNLNINALVVIGGDDSNTNAALLAEYFKTKNPESPIQIIGVPKTIDGDLRNEYIEASFGFHTAARVYSELVSNIAWDARSSRKYYHFIRLMGRHASHITLETMLQTQVNMAIISEEVAFKKRTLDDIVTDICNMVSERAKSGKNFGVILVPEGLVEAVPSMQSLIEELNQVIATHSSEFEELSYVSQQMEFISSKLSQPSLTTFESLPAIIQRQLLWDRDPHGNVQVSRIETEKLIIEMVSDKLAAMKSNGEFSGKFGYQSHFFGYEGRCAAPTNFDANYAYTLGRTASALITMEKTGYICAVKNLAKPTETWEPIGIPLTTMLNFEMRHGKRKPVIKKAIVEMNAPSFVYLKENANKWAQADDYVFAGPIQYFGDKSFTNVPALTLDIDHR